MSAADFRALVLQQNDGGVVSEVQSLPVASLPEGEVLVDVAYSSLNYKDGLALTGAGKVVRSYPMVPGIDLAGIVVESASHAYKPGDRVVLTGWGLGERHWGGYSQKARVRADWLVPLPEGLSLKQSMAIGTAGLTAMLCVMALEEHGLVPGGREVLVTGAAGGVGSVAVAILAARGYRVVASTGRESAREFLTALGAVEVMDRSVLATPSGRPLDSERWGGAIDSVGGETLASVLKSAAYGSAVAACGLAGGTSLPTSVLPFILRGVSLLGVDSVMCPRPRRGAAWARLAQEIPAEPLERISQTVGLQQLPELAPEILKGRIMGRVIVDVSV